MEAKSFKIDGPLLIQTRRFADDRGFFTERFRLDQWQKLQPSHQGFVQDNYSWSKAGVIRGLHFQFNPDQGKLVTCVQGAILDVIVDIRPNSKTCGQHLKVELKGDEPAWFWIPAGFAHGFHVLSGEGAGVLYKVDAPYSPKTEGAILWNDPDLKIDWAAQNPIVSSKDAEAQSFKAYLNSRS